MTASIFTGPGAPEAAPAVPVLAPMSNPIQSYDWGSTSALAVLQSRTPDGGPEAELWMGAHPAGPSELHLTGTADGQSLSLPDAVRQSPDAVLGAGVLAAFGPRLPFMLKVLAIARPLSVQVHPDASRAREAYRPGGDSPYVDEHHKPEMLYALEPVEALAGFRFPAQVAMLLGRLQSERLAGLIEILTGDPDDLNTRADLDVPDEPAASDDPSEHRTVDEAERLHRALALLVNWPLADRAGLVAEIAAGSGRVQAAGNTDYAEAFGWLDRLVGLHPADPMVLAPLLLDLVRLAPGQTLFVAAGMPHCYLSGMGVEILASSDNVLRAGLTSKTVDTEELLQVIDTRPAGPSGVTGTPLTEHETAWRPDVEEFQLSRITVASASEDDPVAGHTSITGPQILLCTQGKVQVRTGDRTVQLICGSSAFVTADAGPLTFGGDGEIFRAAANL